MKPVAKVKRTERIKAIWSGSPYIMVTTRGVNMNKPSSMISMPRIFMTPFIFKSCRFKTIIKRAKVKHIGLK